MNDDRACEVIRLLDSIDTTLREIRAKLCEPQTMTTKLHAAEAQALFAAHAADLQQALSERADRELSEITLTNVFAETDDNKQRLDKWLEQLDKCRCPIQVHIEHDDCCEHGEQDDIT